jgi:hypothetical protein
MMYMTVQRLSSSEFRRLYAQLDIPTEVTALGRVIGTWLPARAPSPMPSASAEHPPSSDAPSPLGSESMGGAKPRKSDAAYKAYARTIKR